MKRVCISGTGLFTPKDHVTNDELVESFNAWVEKTNAENAVAIAEGREQPLAPSSSAFIVKASGIQARYAVDKSGLLDVNRMRPRIENRPDDVPCLEAEIGIAAGRQALERAGLQGSDIDFVVVACSNMQRGYPAISIEIQHYLGAGGYAYDMNVACASATFGLQAAIDAVRMGSAKRALVINPEICTGHMNYRNRDSHFIFGDAATAMVVEAYDEASHSSRFEVLGTRLITKFSSNIRNNFGFLNSAEEPPRPWHDLLFKQEGRKVFKEVVPMVSELIQGHLGDLNVAPNDVKRFWLHQANQSMNDLIAKRVLGREPTSVEAPLVLNEYANTSSAGSVIAFHKYHEDLVENDIGVLCAFGAGYSAGCVVLRRG